MKTGKRELGILFAIVICYEIYIGNTEMVEIIVWPFVTFIAASAGIHTYGKLLKAEPTDTPSRKRP